MKVHWTEAALADLEAIRLYLARHSERFADGLVRKAFNRTELLERNPHLGGIVSEYGLEEVRQLLEYPYRIVYRIRPTQIDIVAVVHGARQMPPNL